MRVPSLVHRFDWLLLASVLLLSTVSLLALYSFSQSVAGNIYFGKQLLFVLLGIGLMIFVAVLDYRHLARMSTLFYFLTLGVLLLVLIIGEPVRGTVGWLTLFGLQVQPVEFAKLALIIFLASFIAKKQTELGEWTRLITSLFLAVFMILLVLKQPDLGSSLVLMFIWGVMIFVSGIRWKHLVVLTLLGSIFLALGWLLLADYQKARLQTFLDPTQDPQGSGYNVLQSMVAVGSGGFWGKGVGHGSQSQLNFLPEKHTDFIYAVIVEELGLVGGMLVLIFYALLLWRIERIAHAARDNTGYLIAIGLLAYFFVHIAINLGMNIGLLPVTGLPAPFLSYGGSSLLASFIGIGLLLSIYRYRESGEGGIMHLERPGLGLR